MTGGFEEWAAARTPSLLAFASALTGDEGLADAAVTRALARMRPAWTRVAREDPDLVARRHVVRTCSTPREAAVVLRLLEERSDAEIAEVLGCSQSAARRHVGRGLVEAEQRRPAEAPPVRDHLAERAGAAPTGLLTRPPAASDPVEPRRHRGVWLAALAVVALVGGVAYASHESHTSDGVIKYPHVDVPTSWRYESYAGVEVQVPATWGWGASPVRSGYFAGPRHLGACGSNQAAVLSPADDSTYVSMFTGFVGRPAITDQRCVTYGSDGSMPTDDAFWFDSPLPVGVKAVGGTVAETREVGGQRITAFSHNRDLRRQILGSAAQVDVDGNGCPTRAVTRPTAGSPSLRPTSLSVCVYSQDTGVATLMWSGALPQHEAQAYADVVEGVSNETTGSCPTPTARWVALGLEGDGDTRWDVVNLGCVRIQRAGGESAPLIQATVLPWAYGGATAYVSTPRKAPELEPYFQAPAG
jgi:DNA-binding CsgD family transcriptional regulator